MNTPLRGNVRLIMAVGLVLAGLAVLAVHLAMDVL